MLFSRREPLSPVEPSLTQRFSNKLEKYLTPATTSDVKRPKNRPTLDIDACYALLGEAAEDKQYPLADLQDQLEKLKQSYQNKTGIALDREQFALAAIKIAAYKQAEPLQDHIVDQNLNNSTLISNTKTSPIHLALMSDALGINTFSDATAKPSTPEFRACRHMMNIKLNDVSMQELESNCRTLLESCSEAMVGRGVDIEPLQSSWLLRMRYDNSENSLLLKCMPIDMLRDTFQRQYIEAFGATPSNQEIIIEALEVTVHSDDETTAGASHDIPYVEDFMQSWRSTSTDSGVIWSKLNLSDSVEHDDHYLNCPVLHKMLSTRVSQVIDSKASDFFIQKI